MAMIKPWTTILVLLIISFCLLFTVNARVLKAAEDSFASSSAVEMEQNLDVLRVKAMKSGGPKVGENMRHKLMATAPSPQLDESGPSPGVGH